MANATDAQKLVEAKIGSKKVVVFSKSHCGFCRKAKSALESYIPGDITQDDYEVVELDGRGDGADIQTYLQTLTGARSVTSHIQIGINKK